MGVLTGYVTFTGEQKLPLVAPRAFSLPCSCLYAVQVCPLLIASTGPEGGRQAGRRGLVLGAAADSLQVHMQKVPESIFFAICAIDGSCKAVPAQKALVASRHHRKRQPGRHSPGHRPPGQQRRQAQTGCEAKKPAHLQEAPAAGPGTGSSGIPHRHSRSPGEVGWAGALQGSRTPKWGSLFPGWMGRSLEEPQGILIKSSCFLTPLTEAG